MLDTPMAGDVPGFRDETTVDRVSQCEPTSSGRIRDAGGDGDGDGDGCNNTGAGQVRGVFPGRLALWACAVQSEGIRGTFAVDPRLAAGQAHSCIKGDRDRSNDMGRGSRGGSTVAKSFAGIPVSTVVRACAAGMNFLSTDCVNDIRGELVQMQKNTIGGLGVG